MPSLSPAGRAFAVMLALLIGLEVYARSTGQEFQLNLLNPSNIGSYITSKAGQVTTSMYPAVNPSSSDQQQAPASGGPPMSGPDPVPTPGTGTAMNFSPYTPLHQTA